MKISGKQLQLVLEKLRRVAVGYNDKDFDISVKMTQEDPGNGIMVECLNFSLEKETPSGTVTLDIELYPSSEGLAPVSKKVTVNKLS